MKILVTGAKGFVGRNLVAQLKNIQEGKAKCYGDLTVSAIYEYDIDSSLEELDVYCRDCDFVFNLAGVNRPQNQEEFMQGNFGFASTLLDILKKHRNTCPVMISYRLNVFLGFVQWNVFRSASKQRRPEANCSRKSNTQMTLYPRLK